MINITFISHKTTLDNENKIASGWNNVPLSDLGLTQAQETKHYFSERKFDIVFCSDHQRSYMTGLLAFEEHHVPIIMDWRLRECNYGDMNGCSKKEMEDKRLESVLAPYPHGESYTDCLNRMSDFLAGLKERYDNLTIVIVGHRATQYGLECICNNKPLEEVVVEPWMWQQEWQYVLN